MSVTSAADFGFTDEQMTPAEGWHCSHFFYTFDRDWLARNPEAVSSGIDQLCQILDPAGSGAPERIQTGLVSGHKADFSIMVMDDDPVKIESVHQAIQASPLGPAIKPSWSYVSLSEISEYVQSVDQYRERLVQSGEQPDSSALETKVNAYVSRLEKMNVQRLKPVFPDWPVSCFYPMNKWRYPGANWFTLSSSERNKLMGEHARSGIKFAGRVSQLITVGVGLDDWEWGVTLWATNPLHLKQIVYDMRFDEASAKYAEFGPFYTSYLATPEKVLAACRLS